MSPTKRYLILSIVLAVIAGAIGAACAVHWLSHREQTSSLHQLVHEDLGLTAEQLTRIDAAEARFATRRVALEQEMQAANRQLASAIEADKSYGPEAQAAINRFHGAMGELQEQTILHVFEMRDVLTPEQQVRFDRTVTVSLTEQER